MPQSKEHLFSSAPVPEAVLRLALPTIVSQIILVLYNMADTFFIGRRGTDAMITAAAVCMPAFMFLSAISNLFGIGAVGVISRSIGARQPEKAKEAASFAFWGCFGAAGLYSLLCFAFLSPYVDLLGGKAGAVHPLAAEYLLLTVVCGGVITAENTLMGHLIRAEGRSLAASVGIGMGGILNILLDPLFMFVIFPRGQEVRAAALATLLSNAAALAYFCLYYLSLKRRKITTLSLRPRRLTKPVVRGVLATGTPACLMTLCENLSYVVLDNLMAANGIPAQAGIGVAKKVNMLAHCMVRGMSQGVLPLIGYTWAAGMRDRMRRAVRLSAGASVGLAVLCMTVSLIFAVPLVRLFNQHGGESVALGAHFLRILCVGGPFSAWAYSCISIFQGVNENRRSLLLALMRKGVLDIPLMFILRIAFPLSGIVAATPLTDGIVCLAAAILYLRFVRRHVETVPDPEDI
ncbi:MAG: hypothetical protein IK132_11110 [Clostridia bacterium]|nr:hypothetical protein [Clostridia bacterium]